METQTFYEVHWIVSDDEVKFKEFDTLKEAQTFEKKLLKEGYETIIQVI
jgi:hypothetical protein